MARVEFLPDVLEDFKCAIRHLEQHQAAHIQKRLGEIVSACDAFMGNPLIRLILRRSRDQPFCCKMRGKRSDL